VELTNEDVADILALLDSLPYDELDLRTPAFRLTLRRAPGGGWTQSRQERPGPGAPATTGVPAVAGGGEGADGETAAGSSPPGPPAGGLIDVIAPLPGTFYRAPRPGAAPFTEVGATVEPDTVVAIVETMKLMNPVPAAARGTVAEILVSNAEAVAQGAALLRIEPGDTA
jgi:acetyl-CoA carboxylase biotin carboxyl carrier protein